MMKRIALISAALICLTFLFPSTQYAKEPVKKPATQKETVPLITEVMTKEELQAYLKEKGIPIITKENFKEPELVWEKTFDEPIREISDITEKGNCIAKGSPVSGTQPDSSLLFINNKGDLRKRIALGNLKENGRDVFVSADVAKSGKYAAVFKVPVKEKKEKIIIFYYDEEGKSLWSKPVDEVYTSIISYNGETIAIQEGNPRWSEEEWSPGDKNINKVRFYNSEGKLLSEYGGYRNFSQWMLSDDGKYFAAYAWRMDDQDREKGSLIYFDVSTGKVLWEKSLKAKHWLNVGGPYSLAVSEKGSYVAAAVMKSDKKKTDGTDDKEVVIFNKDGHPIVRIPGKDVSKVREDNFLSGGSLKKGWIDVNKSKATGLMGYPPYFFKLVDVETIDEKTNDRIAKTHRILSKDEEVLWEKDLLRGHFNFTKDWRYLVGTQYIDKNHKKIIIYKLFINPKL